MVPADKAANNVIVVCKKYYLDVIVNELKSTSTYREVNDECENVVSRHLHYMMKKNSIDVDSEHEYFPSFYWLPKLHIRHHTAPGSLLRLTFARRRLTFARRHSAEICKYRVSIRTHVVEG